MRAKKTNEKPGAAMAEWEFLWSNYINALKAHDENSCTATRRALVAARAALRAFDRRHGHESMDCY